MARLIDVGLEDDQIMQRYLVRRIFHEFELRIVEMDGHQHVGFVTGFDNKCLQISTTPEHAADEPKAVLIYWPYVRRIEETGSRIDCLSTEHRKKIRSYSHALRQQCEKVLNSGMPNPNTNGRKPTEFPSPIV